MEKISAAIFTYNEEQRIEQCLNSLRGIADEIIVVDSYSTDRTIEICNNYGCKITQRKFNGFGAQRQYALSLCTNSYVLSIDADEILDDTLRESIIKLKNEGFTHRIYCFDRLNFYCNHPIRHSGWYPDFTTRLFDRRYASWNLRDVNETLIFPPTLRPYPIDGLLLHYKCNTRDEFLKKQERFAAIDAQILISQHHKPWLLSPMLSAAFAFIRVYFFRLGMRDGAAGREISLIAAKYAYITKHLARRNHKKDNQ